MTNYWNPFTHRWQAQNPNVSGMSANRRRYRPIGPPRVGITIGPSTKQKLNTKRPLGSRTITQNKRRRITMSGASDMTVSRNKWRYRHKRMSRAAKLRNKLRHQMEPNFLRFQGLTQYDTNTGYYPLVYHYNSVTARAALPIHIYNLSALNNTSASVNSPNGGYELGWAGLNTTSALSRRALVSQNPNGSATSALFYSEHTISGTSNVSSCWHDWCSVKFNFYGPRKRTTKFTVMFVQFKNELADPYENADSPEAQQFIQCLERPLIYSNLQVDAQNRLRKYCKVLKRYTYTVSCGQTTDIDTTVGKVHEANIFFRANRHYDLRYKADTTSHLAHSLNDGIDYENEDPVYNMPKPSKRIYMIVMAFQPERSSGTADISDGTTVDPSFQASYDMLIRNKFTTAI